MVAESLLDAALEAIGRAALVVDASGQVVHANTFARASLSGGGAAMRDRLRAVVRASDGPDPDWAMTSVLAEGHATRHLVVARPMKAGATRRIVQAASMWGLTRRQHDVLAQVADGNSNKVIAESLGVSVRTVEAHLTGLFTKAEVVSRAALLVKLAAIE